MRIGVPKELKNNEFRVALTPSGVYDLIQAGHTVKVQHGAGEGSGISTGDYRAVGADIVVDAKDVWASAELVIKVKEPVPSEFAYFRDGLVLFTYLHLAADPALAYALARAGVTAIAYETIEGPGRSLPLLAPMSEVAGRLAPIVGANAMLKANGGSGLLVPGVPGTSRAEVVVIGAGVAGTGAVTVAVGLGAAVTVLDTNLARLRELDALYQGRISTIASTAQAIESSLISADLVIGAVLLPGAKAPKLVTNQAVSKMKSGSVLVDIAIDQGGCFEDSHATTHEKPTFEVHQSVFYCVANMPGAVPKTSTVALTNATLPYVLRIAEKGWQEAIESDPLSRPGVNVRAGAIVNEAVAEALSSSQSYRGNRNPLAASHVSE